MQSIPLVLELSHQLGGEARGFAILGEGNTSARLDAEFFAVKASGSNLATLAKTDLAHCRFDVLLPLLESEPLSDEATDEAMLAARADESQKKPSTEALFHAYLLTLPEVGFVGHTHPVAVNGLLCGPRASQFARHRLFPDHIVCCGLEDVLVPYCNPGVPLARAIRERVEEWMARHQRAPRTILLENHGLIALGKTADAVLATTLMAEKAARIFLGACCSGEPRFLTPEQAAYIAGWSAEHYRQRVLGV
ncbi:Class II Aldolase and Adducin N-terminal domain-containing protein [Abditibacterium utsteinense]|uniref:Class II Aldolase and Adducin N-terminal domain-containing protein n=1 Tax=Abditibacterium utsteinense TaxID=1960156 RepID=A0A2S8SP86_9BACT|nr:class II aldolase/adducin family protein [Abditibacterium utsteinense]PQV62596.1 Class II Aldolase and Adducin N-terminal domain-containing protein [Abditibacterium utsteinense]